MNFCMLLLLSFAVASDSRRLDTFFEVWYEVQAFSADNVLDDWNKIAAHKSLTLVLRRQNTETASMLRGRVAWSLQDTF